MRTISMNKMAGVTCAVLACAVGGAVGAVVSSYQGSYKGALRKAGEAGKPVMIDFYTDWCGWCKVLDKQIGEIPNTMEKFVYYRVNAERDVALAKQFDVTGYPTIVFVKPDGSEFHRWSGAYKTAEVLKGVLEDVAKKAGDIKPKQPQVNSPPASNAASQNSAAETAAAAELRTAQMYYSVGRDADAVKGFRQVIEKYPDTRAAAQAQEKLEQLGRTAQKP